MDVKVISTHNFNGVMVEDEDSLSGTRLLSDGMKHREAVALKDEIISTYGDDFDAMIDCDSIVINGFGNVEVNGVAGYDVKVLGYGFNFLIS